MALTGLTAEDSCRGYSYHIAVVGTGGCRVPQVAQLHSHVEANPAFQSPPVCGVPSSSEV